jgi:hypothetical protein
MRCCLIFWDAITPLGNLLYMQPKGGGGMGGNGWDSG